MVLLLAFGKAPHELGKVPLKVLVPRFSRLSCRARHKVVVGAYCWYTCSLVVQMLMS